MSKLATAAQIEPSKVEQSHIDQALNASETAISAIDTLLNISTWTLGVLAILLAVIGIVGWGVIRAACIGASKQIANKRFDAYIETEAFQKLVQDRIAKSVEERWGKTIVLSRLQEEKPLTGDEPLFPAEPNEGGQK